MSKGILIGTLALFIGVLAAVYYFFKKEPEPLLTIEEYHEEHRAAAEEGGKEAVDRIRESLLGAIGEFATENFEWEHNKMLAAIANNDYSGCVLAYKASHVIPGSGWGNEPYEFCSDAIVNYKKHLSPTVVDIIEQGGKLYERGDNIDDTVNPDAYRWIIANTECISISCEHYQDYERGYRDARLQGYYPTVREGGWRDPQIVAMTFYDKVMEFAGKKQVGFFSGVFTTMKRGEWIW